MLNDIEMLLDDYIRWLREESSLQQVDDWIQITTPFLDRHNDQLQIYVKRENGHYILSDDGYIMQDLRLSGCALDSGKRQEVLRTVLNGYGVTERDEALTTTATAGDFPGRKHNLIQAMIAVNDMFYLASPVIQSIFVEDVANWLDLHDIRYIQNVKLAGHSGFDHVFNFVIPRSRQSPERIVQTINVPRREAAQNVAFRWFDTRDNRPANATAFSILNDTEKPPSAGVMEALRNYGVEPVLWSERDEALQKLAA